MGLVNWAEHGRTFALVQTDGRLYADAAATDHGCALIGVAQNDASCEVELSAYTEELEVTVLEKAALDPTLFEVPSGYKQVERSQKRLAE